MPPAMLKTRSCSHPCLNTCLRSRSPALPQLPSLSQGTSTPLHADVLRSYSWSANIAGRKLWRLLPPQVPSCLQAAMSNWSGLLQAFA